MYPTFSLSKMDVTRTPKPTFIGVYSFDIEWQCQNIYIELKISTCLLFSDYNNAEYITCRANIVKKKVLDVTKTHFTSLVEDLMNT